MKWTSPGGGPILWLEVPEGIDLEDISVRLESKEVMINLSHEAFFGKPHLNGFRIGYAFLPTERMQQGVEILADELKKAL